MRIANYAGFLQERIVSQGATPKSSTRWLWTGSFAPKSRPGKVLKAAGASGN